MTNEQIQMMRDRQINRCEAICKALDMSFHYDVCESGFTEFYFRLNDGSKHLIKRVENIESLPSYTDRPQRPGDIPGVIYNFVTTEEFERMIKDGELYEYNVHHD